MRSWARVQPCRADTPAAACQQGLVRGSVRKTFADTLCSGGRPNVLRLNLLLLASARVLLWTTAVAAQCTRDIDCKGERVCERAICIAPGAASQRSILVEPAKKSLPVQATTLCPKFEDFSVARQPGPWVLPKGVRRVSATEWRNEKRQADRAAKRELRRQIRHHPEQLRHRQPSPYAARSLDRPKPRYARNICHRRGRTNYQGRFPLRDRSGQSGHQRHIGCTISSRRKSWKRMPRARVRLQGRNPSADYKDQSKLLIVLRLLHHRVGAAHQFSDDAVGHLLNVWRCQPASVAALA